MKQYHKSSVLTFRQDKEMYDKTPIYTIHSVYKVNITNETLHIAVILSYKIIMLSYKMYDNA